MAHLALIVDDDVDRREAFVSRIRGTFADLPDAAVSAAHVGGMACVWACGPRAPVSVHRTDGRFAILIGYGIDDDDRWITAADLAESWLGGNAERGIFDGYHVGAVYDACRGLAAAVDPFGLFPLYHAEVGHGAAIVATTPEAFRCHGGFAETIDREGLAGILLVHGPLCDRPLLAGVQRTHRGHRLSWRAGEGLASRAVYEPAGTPPPAGESAADTRRRIDAELIRAIRRHRPAHASTSMLLSGGLDSRLVAGCLAELGAPTRAVILGLPDDYEVLAGAAVARRLDMPHTIVSTDSCDDRFPALARRIVRFGHLNSAPGGEDFGLGLAAAGTTDPFFWSGFALDFAFEPVWAANGGTPGGPAWSFEKQMRLMNAWGVPQAELPALLGDDGDELVAAIIGRFRVACLAGPEDPMLRANVLRWDQRVRNHVSTAVHQTTFVSWPLVPATDRRLFTAILGLEPGVFAERRLEQSILVARRPDLAAIPLDRNSFRFEPLHVPMTPTARTNPLVAAGGLRRLVSSGRRRLRRWYWQRLRGRDPRRYERLFNVDHPRWLAVRREAEPLRGRLHGMLDARALARLLPMPDARMRHANPVNHGGATRLLAALALWTDRPTAPGCLPRRSA